MPSKWTSLRGSVDSSQLSGRDQILFITSSPHHPKQINNLFVTGAGEVEAAYFNACFIITVFEGKKLSKLANLSPLLIKKCLKMKAIFNVLIKYIFCVTLYKFQFVPFPSQWTVWSHGLSGLDNVIRPRDINQWEARSWANQPMRGWEGDHTGAPLSGPKLYRERREKRGICRGVRPVTTG